MIFDVFISHSSKDNLAAAVICEDMEAADIRCWIAPRDIRPGADWADAIMEGIEKCKFMVLVYSSHANQSRQVKREVQQAFEQGLTVVPFRLENVPMDRALKYYCGSVHWLDALTPPLKSHVLVLIERLKALMLIATTGIASEDIESQHRKTPPDINTSQTLLDVLTRTMDRLPPGTSEDSLFGRVTLLDAITRGLLAHALLPLVISGRVPTQDKQGGISALTERPLQTLDFSNSKAVTAQWMIENWPVLRPALASSICSQLNLISSTSLLSVDFFLEVFYEYSRARFADADRSDRLLRNFDDLSHTQAKRHLTTLRKLMAHARSHLDGYGYQELSRSAIEEISDEGPPAGE